MILPGRLASTTLGDLLGALCRDGATGVLELIEASGPRAGRVHRVHLDSGLVESIETPIGVARLGEILENIGFLDGAARARLDRRAAELPGRRVGELLIEDRVVSPMAVRAALRRQLRARVEALFALTDAYLRFRVARPRACDDDGAVPLSPREVLHGRARRRDRSRERAPAGRPPQPANDTRASALRVLGLDRDADRDAVQRAFRRLAASVHPDRHPRATSAERAALLRRFAALSAAYHSLVA
jgi:hypothetical protein